MSPDLDVAPSPTVVKPLAGRRGPRSPAGTGSVIGFTLRRGILAFCVAGYLVASVAVMTLRGAQWRGDLVWMLDWITVGHVIVGPVVAGCAAIDSARLTVGLEHLRTRRHRDAAVGVGWAYAAVLGVVHVVVVLVLTVVFWPARIVDNAWLAVLAQVVMLGFFVALGVAVGRFARPPLAGVSAAIAALAAVYLTASPGGHVGLLYGGAATAPRIGYAYEPWFLAAQVAVLLLVSGALLALRRLGHGRGWRRVRPRDAVAALVLVVAAVLVSTTAPNDRLTHATVEPTFCGAVVTIPVCYYPEHKRVVEAFDHELWVLFSSAQDAGYGGLVPERVVQASQTSWPADPWVGVVYIGADNLSGELPTTWSVAQGLVQPLHCEGVRQDEAPREKYWEDLDALTATWAMLVDPALGEANGYYGDVLPPDAAVDLMEQFRTCTYPFL